MRACWVRSRGNELILNLTFVTVVGALLLVDVVTAAAALVTAIHQYVFRNPTHVLEVSEI